MTERKPFLLRIDAELYTELSHWAGDEKRSLNGQIEFLLQRILREARQVPASTRGPERLSTPPERQPEHASGVRRREPASPSIPAPRPPARKAASPGARRRRATSVSAPPSGVPAQGRRPAPRRIPVPLPAARKPAVESPPARVPKDDWDAMVD